MRTTVIKGGVKDNQHFVLIANGITPTSDRVGDWTTVLQQYRTVLNQLSNYPPPSTDSYVEVPYIMRVTHYNPPPSKPVPQLKKPTADKQYIQPKGWFHHKQDPKDRASVRISVRSRRILKPVQPTPKIETFKCISCFAPHNVFERNIRGRILRGYMVVKNGRTIIQDFPEISGRPSPCYHDGRLCETCFPKYSLQADNPTDYKSIQLIKDFKGPVTKRDPITIGKVETEDKREEDALVAAIKLARPKIKGLVRDVGKVNTRHKLETNCSVCSEHDGSHVPRCTTCNAPTESAPERIHPNAFRKFMQSRKGGMKNYDMEVNFSNQKKG